MLGKIKPYAFTEFARRYGKDFLLDCLERNEKKGVIYHRDGINGDYDDFDNVIKNILDSNITIIVNGYDVLSSLEAVELSKKYNKPGISTVPQIIINDHYVGGYDDLENLYKTKKLNDFLK